MQGAEQELSYQIMHTPSDLNVLRADHLFSLNGRIAVVTGASGGLGRLFAQVLAANGATVGLAARRYARVECIAESINAAGGSAMALEMDVTSTTSIDQALEALQLQFGPVDLVINNAGQSAVGRALDLTDEEWSTAMDVNVHAMLRVSRSASNRMIEAKIPGSIINIASILGIHVKPGAGAYAVSKAGVIQLTRILAVELARHHIRVNTLAPGYVETDMNRIFLASEAGQKMALQVPQRRTGLASELAGAILLLASNAGSYMTGSTVIVDGGHTLVIP